MVSHLEELEMEMERRRTMRRYLASWEKVDLWDGPGLYVPLPIVPMLGPGAYTHHGDANASRMNSLDAKRPGKNIGINLGNNTEEEHEKHRRKDEDQVCNWNAAQWRVEKQCRYFGQPEQRQERSEQSLDTKIIRDDYFQAVGETFGGINTGTCTLACSSSSSNNERSQDKQEDDETNISQLSAQPESFGQTTLYNAPTDIPANNDRTFRQVCAVRPRLERPESLLKYWAFNEDRQSTKGRSANISHGQVTTTQGTTVVSAPIDADGAVVVPTQRVAITWSHNHSELLPENLINVLPSCLYSAQMAQMARGLENAHIRESEWSVGGREVSENASLNLSSIQFSFSAIQNTALGKSRFEEMRIAQILNTFMRWRPPTRSQESRSVHPDYDPQRPHSPYLFNPRCQPEVDQYWDRVFGEYAQHQADQFIRSNPHLAHEYSTNTRKPS